MPRFKTICHILLFVTCGVFTACKKDVPKGAIISTKGYVIDTVKNKRLANVPIYLVGAHQTFYGIYYDVGPLDSTFSDKDGNFSIAYTATGNSIDYALQVGQFNFNGNTGQNGFIPDNSQRMVIFDYAFRLDNVVLLARELNYALVKLNVASNPYDTLYLNISSPLGEFFLRYPVIGSSIDTSVLVRYLPDATNDFEYAILSEDLLDSANGYQRKVVDTLNLPLTDTIVILKTIGSAYDLPLLPY
jgi:hypothetical protein